MKKAASKGTKNYENILSAMLFAIAGLTILLNPSVSSVGAVNGLKLCSSAIIPTLFPFMVATIFFQKSGGLYFIGEKINKITYKIFKIDGNIFSVILISLLGGYPIAPKLLNEMYKENTITDFQAKNALKFCINPSPVFFINFIGIGILNNKNLGVMLFVSNTFVCLILNIIIFRKCNNLPNTKRFLKEKTSITDAFVFSVSEGCSVMLNICAWIIVFSSFGGLIKTSVNNNEIYSYIAPFLEITYGCIEFGKSGISIFILPLFLAIGGFSTLCQVKLVIKNIDFSFTDLITYRCIHGVLAAAIFSLLIKLFPQSVDVISNTNSPINRVFPLEISSVILCLTAIVFLIYLKPGVTPKFD